MKHSFIFNVIFVLLINLFIKPIYLFGIDRNIQLITGSEYGVFYTFFSLALILNIVSDGGLQNFNLRFSSQSPQLIGKYFRHFLQLKLFLGLAFFLLYFGVGLLSAYPIKYPELFALVGLSLWLNALLLFLRSFVAGMGVYWLDSVFSVLDKLFMIVVMGYFILYHPEQITINLFAKFLACSYLIPIVLAFGIIVYNNKIKWNQWKFKGSLSILKQSLPYALVIFLMGVYLRVDALMLAWLDPLKTDAVDLYAKSYRILEAFNMFGYLVSGLLLPMFSRNFHSKSNPKDIFYTALGFSATIAFPVTLTACLFSDPIMSTLYYNTEGALLLKWHMVAFALNTLAYIYGTLITAHGSISKLNRLFLSGVILNIILNSFIIPSHGAVGAAITSVATQVLILVGQAIYVHKTLNLEFRTKTWFRLGLYAALCCILGIAATKFSTYDWFVELFGIITLCLILSPVLGLFEIKSVINLVLAKIKPSKQSL